VRADPGIRDDAVGRPGSRVLVEPVGTEADEHDLVQAGAVANHAADGIDGIDHDRRLGSQQIIGSDDVPGLLTAAEREAIPRLRTLRSRIARLSGRVLGNAHHNPGAESGSKQGAA
jgi:hypothetical protein